MEPEFRRMAKDYLFEPAHANRLLVGQLYNVRRHFHAAAARAELAPVRANLGLRASHSTLLMARGYPYEYVRQVLGHEGEVRAVRGETGPLRAATGRPSTLSRHYLRSSPDMFVAALNAAIAKPRPIEK